jgi:hypothetical protein
MRKIVVQNPTTDETYKTWLSSAYTSGAALSVISNTTFAADDMIIVGEVGEEKTELKNTSSVSGATTINIDSALNFTHPKDSPVYRVLWDFVSIERDGSEITQSGIQWDKKDTIYYDADGTASSNYRFRFYNSNTATYSDYSPTITGTGYTRPSAGYMIRQVRQIVRDEERKITTDAEIMRFLNAAQDIIGGIRNDWWFLATTDTSTTSVASTASYALPSAIGNIGQVDLILAAFNDGDTDITYNLKYEPRIQFDHNTRDDTADNDDNTLAYTLLPADSSSASGYFEVRPTPNSTNIVFEIRYFRKMTDLDTVDDETDVPMPAILENYAIAQIEKIRGNDDKARVYERMFWGPAPSEEKRRTLSGIALLEQINSSKRRPSGQPQQLFKFIGQRAIKNMFGDRTVDRDKLHEDYW